MLYRAPSDPRPPLSVRYLHELGVLCDFLDRVQNSIVFGATQMSFPIRRLYSFDAFANEAILQDLQFRRRELGSTVSGNVASETTSKASEMFMRLSSPSAMPTKRASAPSSSASSLTVRVGSPHKQCFVSRFENLLRKTSRLDNDFAAYSFSRVDQAS
ncbi:hypothetical protein R1flu_027201 [Riccia fluitans]|uniref:Uncharacterized protein n=1 Tax=Riccia fluitans TaxID=41844 RepID=A0ABD1XIV2_9MARC